MLVSPDKAQRARQLIADKLGLVLPRARELDLDDILRRTARESGLTDIAQLVERLERGWVTDLEWGRLVSHITVGETSFFRYADSFRAIEEQILPQLIQGRRIQGERRLRIWSAGCATGEEAYSLAILLKRLLIDRRDWDITLLATDINPVALEVARCAVYRTWSLRHMSDELRRQYFIPREDLTFELMPEIRDMVTFGLHNLAVDADLPRAAGSQGMDLILCRNVLIYFTQEAQRAAAIHLRQALQGDGWLMTTPAEASIELFRPLHPVVLGDAMAFRPAVASGAASIDIYPAPLSTVAPFATAAATIPAFMFEPDRAPPPPSAATAPPMPVSVDKPLPGKETVEAPSLERASSLADQGRLDEARRVCRAAIERDRLASEPYRLLAAICEEMGDLDGAGEALRSTIYLAPDSASGHFLLGRLMLRKGSIDEARRSMLAVLRLIDADASVGAASEGGAWSPRRLRETAAAQIAAIDRTLEAGP